MILNDQAQKAEELTAALLLSAAGGFRYPKVFGGCGGCGSSERQYLAESQKYSGGAGGGPQSFGYFPAFRMETAAVLPPPRPR